MTVFETWDWIVVGAYFAVLAGVAWWVLQQKQESTADYFLAGRHVGWFVIGASIFASNIGSEHIVGLAGTAAKSGVVMGHYELHSWLILLLGWVFVPFYMRSRVFTMPEFLERRYSASARWFLSLVTLVGYILTKVSVTVYAGAVVFQVLMGVDFWSGAMIVVILTGIYTVVGGLRAVVYTEAMQAIVLIAGSATITIVGLMKIGGWDALLATAGQQRFNLFLPADHPDFPWTGMVFAPPIVGLWYWCTDQYIVQRTLAARNETQARRGTIFAAYLKLLPFFIFIIPGVIAYALAQSGQLNLSEADQAFPIMVRELLPAGLRGLVAGGLLAALMSSLAAVFNSCSTIFTMDIYRKLKPDASERTFDGGAYCDRNRRGIGHSLDPGHEKHIRRGLPLSAECPGIYCPSDRRGFFPGAFLETHQRRRRHGDSHGRVRAGDGSSCRRAQQGVIERFSPQLRRLELPPLCDLSVSGLRRDTCRRQHDDGAATRKSDPRLDLCNHSFGGSRQVPCELEPARRRPVSCRHRRHSGDPGVLLVLGGGTVEALSASRS